MTIIGIFLETLLPKRQLPCIVIPMRDINCDVDDDSKWKDDKLHGHPNNDIFDDNDNVYAKFTRVKP